MKVVHISVQSVKASLLLKPAEDLKEEGLDYDLFCVNYDEIDDDPLKYQRLIKETETADLIFIRCMGDTSKFKRYEKYEKVLKVCKGYVFIHVSDELIPLYRGLFKGTDDDLRILLTLSSERGYENDKGILLWLAYKLGKKDELPVVVRNRTDGIYHPDFPRDITMEEYMKNIRPGLPTVGLLFSGNIWVYNDLEHIDAMIHQLEADEMNVIPFFYQIPSSYNNVSNKDYVKKYLTNGTDSIVDVLIVTSGLSMLVRDRSSTGMKTIDEENFFQYLTGVPVLQAMTIKSEYCDYEASVIGLNKAEISISVAWPEVDGEIITVPIGHAPPDHRIINKSAAIIDRIKHVSKVAMKWAILNKIPPSERKIAILMYQSRPNSGRIGNAAGLDVPESVSIMLNKMSGLGYNITDIPKNGKEMISEILDNITNDLESTPSKIIEEKAADVVSKKDYLKHFNEIPEFNQKEMISSWGEPPGTVCTDKTKIVIPGIVKGNVFIGYQPIRAWSDKFEELYHDPVMMANHQYLEFYRWLQYDFKANMIVHMGTHGTLEWLPGKNVGLSCKCNPDVILDGVPNVYPYVIDDPGEGIQTRRRSESVVIGHMNPTMARAGSYDDLAEVEVPLQEYFKQRGVRGNKKSALIIAIYEAAKKLSLFDDLHIEGDPGSEGFEQYLDDLHDYITEIKDALIRDGLHILGCIPSEEHMDEHIYSIMRLDNGSIPSLRNSLAETMGYDMSEMIDHPTEFNSKGELNSISIDIVDAELNRLLLDMRTVDYNKENCLAFISKRFTDTSGSLLISVSYICDFLAPNLKKMSEEISNMMGAFDGKYVLPGPSGAPTRGNAHILPMGRNFFGIDPDGVPTSASWRVGVKMADQMIEKFVDEKGAYPKQVGMILWATDTMKTTGDDVAYVLWLMGVRPVWSKLGGQVIDIEVVPISELNRARIDVTVSITGLFRDVFSNLIDLIDDAVKLVSALDETDEENNIAANLRKDVIEGMASGLTIDEARRKASMRIFGAPPGAYGTGVNHAIESSSWKTVEDLADIYAEWTSHVYGRGVYGESMKDQFVKRFGNVEATIKNMPDREIDLVDCDDVYEYLGGMNTFVRAYGRKDVMSIMGDGSDPNKTKVKDTKAELQFVMRSKVLNPKYINGLKKHGYSGAAVLADVTEYVFAWDATSAIVDDWMYEQMADRFLFDKDTKDWIITENPFAAMNILNRLYEAIDRGLWNADDNMLNKLQDLYNEVEQKLEEVTERV